MAGWHVIRELAWGLDAGDEVHGGDINITLALLLKSTHHESTYLSRQSVIIYLSSPPFLPALRCPHGLPTRYLRLPRRCCFRIPAAALTDLSHAIPR